MLSIGTYGQQDLLYCIDGLGKRTEVVDDEGNTVTIYEKGPEALECTQDLQRFLRRDDFEMKSYHQQIGKWDTMSKHILPLFLTYQNNEEIVFETLKLMVMLTLPPDRKMRSVHTYVRYLQNYKDSFMKKDVVAVLMTVIAKPFEKKGKNRTKKDIELIELILTLVRNLLSIPDVKQSTSSSESHMYSLQDRFIAELDTEHFFDFLVILGNNIEEIENKGQALLLVEILYLAYRREEPKQLAYIEYTKGTNMGQKLGDALKALRESSVSFNSSKPPTRHSRFGGCFVSNSQVGGKSLQLKFDAKEKGQDKKLTLADRRKNKGSGITPKQVSGNKTKIILKEFAERLSLHCFNEIVKVAKTDIVNASTHIMPADHYNFTWFIGFFSGFITHTVLRNQKSDVTLPKEVLEFSYLSNAFDEQIFNYVIQNIEIFTNEKKLESLSLQVQTLRYLMETLQALCNSSNIDEKRSGEALLVKLIYRPDLVLERMITLIKHFNSNRNTREYMQNVAYTIHALMKTLETCLKDDKKMFLQLKKNTGRVTSLKKDEDYEKEKSHYVYDDFIVEYDEDELEEQEKKKKKEEVLDEGLELLLDDDSLDEDNTDAPTVSAKKLLLEDDEETPINKEKETPETKVKTEEDLLLEELFSADSDKEEETPGSPQQSTLDSLRGPLEHHEDSVSDDGHVYGDDDEEDAAQKEKYFEFDIYVNSYARQSVIRAYMFLLKNFKYNDAYLNHCIITMYRRISDFLDLKPMFFQVTYLRVFNDILNAPMTTKGDENLAEARIFSAEIIKAMVIAFRADSVKFVSQMLFSKNKWEVDIEHLSEKTIHTSTKDSRIETDISKTENVQDAEDEEDEWEEMEDFDLDEMIQKETAKQVATKRVWTETDDLNLKDTYLNFKDVDGMNLVDVVVSMVDIPNLTPMECYNRLIELEITDGNDLVKPEEEVVEESYKAPVVAVVKKKKRVNKTKKRKGINEIADIVEKKQKKKKKETSSDKEDEDELEKYLKEEVSTKKVKKIKKKEKKEKLTDDEEEDELEKYLKEEMKSSVKKKSKKDGNTETSTAKRNKKRKKSDKEDPHQDLPTTKKVAKEKSGEEYEDLLGDISLDDEI